MELDRLWDQLNRQHSQIDGLRDEVTILRTCLEGRGFVDGERYCAQLHRWRFACVRESHPLVSNSCVRRLLDIEDIAFSIARCAGPPAMWRLCAAAPSLGKAISRVKSEVLTLYPQSVVVCGGNDGSQRLSSAERLDPATGTWEPLPPMLERRSSVAAAVLCGRRGGSNGVRILSSTECFDPSLGTWTRMLPMLERRERAVACVVSGKLYVCGGFDGRQRLSSAERFHGEVDFCLPGSTAPGDQEDRWEVIPSTLECRSQAAAAVIASRLYICGGYDGTTILDSVECFDPDANEWLPMPSMLQRRSQAAATVLTGILYLCGGYDGTSRLNSVERFDPNAFCWEHIAPIAERRSRAVASVVAGMLYVFGGFNGEQRLSSAERFDSESGNWYPVKPMQCPREGAAAASFRWSHARPQPQMALAMPDRPAESMDGVLERSAEAVGSCVATCSHVKVAPTPSRPRVDLSKCRV